MTRLRSVKRWVAACADSTDSTKAIWRAPRLLQMLRLYDALHVKDWLDKHDVMRIAQCGDRQARRLMHLFAAADVVEYLNNWDIGIGTNQIRLKRK